MLFMNILPLLLAPLAAASPATATAGLSARDDNANIFDSPEYRGQRRTIPANGICVNLGPPFSTPGRGTQSLLLTPVVNCEFYRATNCQDFDPVVIFQSQSRIRITAYSIRCSKTPVDDDDD
ncbi:uncharacterized protein BBA_02413 [Beauveria bassiana ARSEF 2860]|uniref:Uncharacterized protein n=1 Tax=Beauveria bassiana (strain ARSEF 2860) TaxID=655819 RepID=J5K2U5_BEAB2|nr:uncharacterized protein BBA_02413 [Beauveria bassiana ARSEF 2860]EJP68411.1 hypothetical protein BBA_02413 [Beauveria bassiana ARSEF 2860]